MPGILHGRVEVLLTDGIVAYVKAGEERILFVHLANIVVDTAVMKRRLGSATKRNVAGGQKGTAKPRVSAGLAAALDLLNAEVKKLL